MVRSPLNLVLREQVRSPSISILKLKLDAFGGKFSLAELFTSVKMTKSLKTLDACFFFFFLELCKADETSKKLSRMFRYYAYVMDKSLVQVICIIYNSTTFYFYVTSWFFF